MKITKIINGLVVCWALMFTGVLSSSAKEINISKPTMSVNSSAMKEIKQFSFDPVKSIELVSCKPRHMGPFINDTHIGWAPAPYQPPVYTGVLYYSHYEFENGYCYTGVVHLKTKY